MNAPQIEKDLDFVRNVLDRSTPPAAIRSIYFLWAAAV
jgi:hypothetical protein